MLWAVLSVCAALFWAVGAIIDKYLLSGRVDVSTVLTFACATAFVFGLLIILLNPVSLSLYHIHLVLSLGFLWTAAMLLYFKAVACEEISRIIPVYYTSPFFVAVLAAIFLNEIFSMLVYVGIALILTGTILLTIRKDSVKLTKGFCYAFLSTLIFSIASVFIKYLLNFLDFWSVFAYGRVGSAFALLPLLYLYRKRIMKLNLKNTILLFTTEGLNNLAALMLITAASIGYITLVNAFSSIEPLFVFLFVLICTIKFPNIIKEKLNTKTAILRFLGILAILSGASLIV